tara:strand:- start:345 stop:788 length:444 start_codon:yes stop_codon:yes gene_type:complete
MKKMIFTLALGLLTAVGANAQDVQNAKGDWYLGTGNIADIAWTDWSVSPSIGYGVTDKLMIGANLSQADADTDLSMDLHARYFTSVSGQDLFVYVASEDVTNLDTKSLNVGVGKFFTFRKGVYVDPKVVYSLSEKTTNLQLGFGLKF